MKLNRILSVVDKLHKNQAMICGIWRLRPFICADRGRSRGHTEDVSEWWENNEVTVVKGSPWGGQALCFPTPPLPLCPAGFLLVHHLFSKTFGISHGSQNLAHNIFLTNNFSEYLLSSTMQLVYWEGKLFCESDLVMDESGLRSPSLIPVKRLTVKTHWDSASIILCKRLSYNPNTRW